MGAKKILKAGEVAANHVAHVFMEIPYVGFPIGVVTGWATYLVVEPFALVVAGVYAAGTGVGRGAKHLCSSHCDHYLKKPEQSEKEFSTQIACHTASNSSAFTSESAASEWIKAKARKTTQVSVTDVSTYKKRKPLPTTANTTCPSAAYSPGFK